ncbi:MAG: hypothetical protein AAGF01_14285, partial [Cyanobacteria bacterium P01_G01_bin.38]
MQTVDLTMTAAETALGLALPHYQLMQRMRNRLEGNVTIEGPMSGMCIRGDRLPLGSALLGPYDQFSALADGLLDELIEITAVSLCFIEGDPGLVGEPGREINTEGEIQVPQNTKLRLEGTVTLLDTAGVSLTADFFVKRGEPNLSFRFTLPAPQTNVAPTLGIGTFFPDVPLVRALQYTNPVIILTTTDAAYDPALDANVNTGLNFYGTFLTQDTGDRTLDFIGGILRTRA